MDSLFSPQHLGQPIYVLKPGKHTTIHNKILLD